MFPNDTSVWNAKMSYPAFASVNVPLSVVSIIMNIYLLFCMAFPDEGSERLKQPLNVLLGSLFGFNTALHVCTLLWALRNFINLFSSEASNFLFSWFVLHFVLFSVRASVTSSLWLNVFYYCQIVPPQRSVSVWLKKNIRVFIYAALILDKTYVLFGLIINISDTVVYFNEYFVYPADVNNTDTDQNTTFAFDILLHEIVLVNFWLRLGINLLSLCVMSAASCATILYLWRHMRNMKDSNSSFSSSCLQKQMRVTTTGIIQVLLYFLCSSWMSVDAVLRIQLPVPFDTERHILCTVISLYSFLTTINVCVGQSVFRQRVAHLWRKFLQNSFPICTLNE